MDSNEEGTVTQHCQCGSETYHVKTTDDRSKVWVECTECGRPTAVVGDGEEMQRRWYASEDA